MMFLLKKSTHLVSSQKRRQKYFHRTGNYSSLNAGGWKKIEILVEREEENVIDLLFSSVV